MKFVVTWTARGSGSGAENEQAVKRALEVYSKWSPPSGVTFHQFLTRVDANGGFAVVETEDPKLSAEGPAKFSPWFEFTVVPVIDVTEGVPILNEAVQFRDAIT
jgi:hypothetical protein